MRSPTSWGTGSPAHEAVTTGTLAMHCHTTWGAVGSAIPASTAPSPMGGGKWDSCNALPRCLGAVGNGTPATHCLIAWGRWAMELVQCAGPLARGTGVLIQEAVAA